MQALWSRTGLSSRCACRACDQVLSAGRRATTKASRRKATFADAFTALYSSFLATAAVVEAVRKEDRKAKVDAELEQVRNELSELRAKRALRELQLGISEERLRGDDIPESDLTDLQNRALWEQWRQILDSDGFLDDAWRADGMGNITLALNRHHVRPFGGSRLESTTILRAECTRIMRHIQAEELDENIEPTKFTRAVHFESAISQMRAYIKGMLIMAEKLCQERQMPRTNFKHYEQKKRFVRDTGGIVGDRHRRAHIKSRWPPAHGGGEPRKSALSQAWEAFRSPVPEFWFENHPLQRENTRRLNDHIRELFRDDNLPLDELLGHISLGILRSPCLPDVHTHNLLMAGFTRRRFHVLASHAYELFFSESNKHRSTPASLAMSVTAPAMFWDIAGFKRAAAAIIGRDPSIGAKIARRPLEDVIHDGYSLSWATDSARRGIAGRWVNAYAPMDLALREALISCLLHLRQHIDAASFFLACLQTGASVASAVVFELFNAIAKTPDARSAVRLVRGLSVRANKFGEFLRSMPEDIRGCVCRRLDYLLHIINLRRLDVQFVDETIYDLGMRRRHLERLIDVLEEHGYTNEAMNMGRSTFNLLQEGTRAVAISRPKALSLGSARMTATTKQFHLKGAIAQWAPDVDSEQAAKRIHARMRETVQAEVERQIRDHAQDAVRLRVQAHLRKHLQDQDAEEPAQVQSSEDHSPEDDSLRRHIEESIEETIRLEVHRQVEEQLRAVKEGQNASRDQADSALGPWFGDSPEAADEWFSHRRHLQQVGTGS